MKKRYFLIIVLIFWAFFFSLVLAEDNLPDIEIKQVYPEHLEVEPGRAITVSLLVSNHAAADVELKEELQLPPDWSEILPSSRFKLNSNDQQVRFVSFFIPKTCAAGSYQINYSLLDQNTSGKSISVKLDVKVLPVSTVRSLIDEKPQVVIAGEKYAVKLRYINTGNCIVSLTFTVKGTPDYAMEITPAEMDLEPGAFKVLTINVQTDAKLKSEINHFLNIEAKDRNSFQIYSEDNILVDILPKINGEYDIFHSIPSQIKITAGFENQENSDRIGPELQVDFSTAGSIDDMEENKINWWFLTPNLFNLSSGEKPSFQMNYTNDRLNLKFGNKSLLFSPLTKRWDNLSNIMLDYNRDKSTFGLVYGDDHDWGIHYNFQLNPFTNLQANYLNDSIQSNKILSLHTEIKPKVNAVLNFEYGLAHLDNDQNISSAYHFNYRSSSNPLNYSFEKIYAAPKFTGNYNDVDSTNGVVSYSFYDKFQTSFSFHSYRNNLAFVKKEESTHNELVYNANLSYIFSPRTVFSLTWDDSRKKEFKNDLSKVSDDAVKLVKFVVQHNYSKWRLVAFGEGGTFEDKFSHQDDGFFKAANLDFDYFPNRKQTYTLYTNFADRYIPAISETKNTIGATFKMQISDNLNLDLGYQKDYFYNVVPVTQDSLTFNCSYAINQLSMMLKGSYISDNDPAKFSASFLATYTLPWNLPAAKRKDLGVLKGKVYDAGQPEAPPLSNVILRANGISSVTNEQGEFVFAALPPGIYAVSIDKSLIGLNMVATEKMPLSVEVKNGETTDIQIGMAPAGKITGKVTLLTPDQAKELNSLYTSNDNLYAIKDNANPAAETPVNPDKLKESGGLTDTLIEITDSQETFRQVTDETGAFSFAGMRPGKWRLKAYANTLPPHYYFDTAGIEVDLKSGETKNVDIKAIPQIRTVQIIEEGEIETSNATQEQQPSPGEPVVIKENKVQQLLVSPQTVLEQIGALQKNYLLGDKVFADIMYIVKNDDTVTSIAKKFGVAAEQINAKNFLAGTDTLKINAVIIIPVPLECIYIVKPEETLEEIAKRYGTTVEIIKDLSSINGSVAIKPGQTLILPGKGLK